MNIFSFKGFDFVVLLLFFSKLSMNWFSYTFFFKCFTATKALEEFNHDYLKGYVMKIKLCPNEADEKTESKNINSFDSNDGRAVASGEAVGAQGRSVSPISTRGGTFSPPSTASPLRFSDLASALDGESDPSENCRCRRYCNCNCQVNEG